MGLPKQVLGIKSLKRHLQVWFGKNLAPVFAHRVYTAIELLTLKQRVNKGVCFFCCQSCRSASHLFEHGKNLVSVVLAVQVFFIMLDAIYKFQPVNRHEPFTYRFAYLSFKSGTRAENAFKVF